MSIVTGGDSGYYVADAAREAPEDPNVVATPPVRFVVLGIHGPDVRRVNGVKLEAAEDGSTTAVEVVRNVARVRMFIGDKVVDDDFELPYTELPGTIMTTELYECLMKDVIEQRIDELSVMSTEQLETVIAEVMP